MAFILANTDAATRASTDETEGCQLDCISCNWSKEEKESGFTRIWIRDRGIRFKCSSPRQLWSWNNQTVYATKDNAGEPQGPHILFRK
ncbi:UNVERIFIED_CONTAM: hypothetical protein H355_007482 [Colinus virginianus]|nr:hypothetical protein H355_007482 [Colinus virginianus]